MIDAADATEVGRFNWSDNPSKITTYARRGVYAGKRRTTSESLHRFVAKLMGLSGMVDHINGNGLDCRRSNLRAATAEENARNMRISRRNKSGVKGVSWYSNLGKWVAEIMTGGHKTRLGGFDSIEEAATAVATARDQLHGEFANHGTKETLQ